MELPGAPGAGKIRSLDFRDPDLNHLLNGAIILKLMTERFRLFSILASFFHKKAFMGFFNPELSLRAS